MYLITILILFFIRNINCDHITANNSDIIVTYSHHAEANSPQTAVIPENKTTSSTENIKIIIPEYLIQEAHTTTTSEVPELPEVTEDVVFIPNGKSVERIGDEFSNNVRIGDMMSKKTIGDVLFKGGIHLQTEAPNGDALFISGKNNENVGKESEGEKEKHHETRRSGKGMPKKLNMTLNCNNLDCNNTISSICGGKLDRSTWKYRLFMNECYFRKVNCNFKYEINRYIQMDHDKCKNIGSHRVFNSVSPFSLKSNIKYQLIKNKPINTNNTRRTFSSRRSLSMGADGQVCSHPCPPSCPDEYEPECAVSGTGQRRVFVNHCKLDFNSCFYNVVWHRRPLSECVGGKTADVRQNRGFIGWMQRVGIVDNKGRLVLS